MRRLDDDRSHAARHLERAAVCAQPLVIVVVPIDGEAHLREPA